MTAVEASKKDDEVRVYRNLYPDLTRRPMRAKFKIGDKVRIQKKKGVFEKGFTPNWTEVFIVSKIQRTNPVTYKLNDLNEEEIQGTFYEQELQKTSQRSLQNWEECEEKQNKVIGEMEGASWKFQHLGWQQRSYQTLK